MAIMLATTVAVTKASSETKPALVRGRVRG